MQSPDWTQMEQGALENFMSTPGGPLNTALDKFITYMAQAHRAQCAAAMATVPRAPELASDHAAKAQLLDEFWIALAEVMAQERRVQEPAPTSTL